MNRPIRRPGPTGRPPRPAGEARAAANGLAMEDLPDFLRFAPVPVRPRHDGWTPERQMRLVVELARGAGIEEAARALGRSAQSAYALRRRSGGGSFAAAWDRATAFAAHARGAAFQAARIPGVSRASGIETLLVPRFYRGRLVGYVAREDVAGAMTRLRRLDRLADRFEAEGRTEALRAVAERLGPLDGS